MVVPMHLERIDEAYARVNGAAGAECLFAKRVEVTHAGVPVLAPAL